MTRTTRQGRGAAALVLTVALALSACSGSDDSDEDSEPDDSGSSESVPFGDLGRLEGVGEGYVLFANAEYTEGTTESQSLLRMDDGEAIQWSEPALDIPEADPDDPATIGGLRLSDAGLFAEGESQTSSIGSESVIARLDPDTGDALWEQPAESSDGASCDYTTSGGAVVLASCRGGGDEVAQVHDAETGDVIVELTGADGVPDGITEDRVLSFDPLVIRGPSEEEGVSRLLSVDETSGEIDVTEVKDMTQLDLVELSAVQDPHDRQPGYRSFRDAGLVIGSTNVHTGVAAVSVEDGSEAWSVPGEQVGVLGVGDGKVVVRSEQTETVAVLDAETGEEIDAFPYGEENPYGVIDRVALPGDDVIVVDYAPSTSTGVPLADRAMPYELFQDLESTLEELENTN